MACALQVFFEFNGMPRTVMIPDRNAQLHKVVRPKAVAGDAGSVGAPMPGVVHETKVKPGEHVAAGEPMVTRKWMENYSTDQVRYLARSFGIPGDHVGQTSTGIRMPFGGVAVVTPFNFPLEICALQTCSALFMGNQPTVKVDWKVHAPGRSGRKKPRSPETARRAPPE